MLCLVHEAEQGHRVPILNVAGRWEEGGCHRLRVFAILASRLLRQPAIWFFSTFQRTPALAVGAVAKPMTSCVAETAEM
jgi:hypothetical protein